MTLAVLASGYRFAVDDQVQYLAWANALRDPAGLAGDPYIEAFASLRSLIWHPIAWLVPKPLVPAALGVAVVISGFAAALLAMRLARAIGGGTLAAILAALVLVVPKERNWFGLVALVDGEFTATMIGVPLALGAMLAIVRARPMLALGIAALAVPVHAQTGAALLTATTIWLGVFAGPRFRPLACGLALVGGAGLLSYRAGRAVAPEKLPEVEHLGRQLYAQLIDATASPPTAWVALAALLMIGAAAAVSLRGPEARRLRSWTLASLAAPLAAVGLLALGVRDPALWTLMPGRWFMLAQLAALIMLAASAPANKPLLLAAIVLAVWPTELGRTIDGVLLVAAVGLAVGSALARSPRASSAQSSVGSAAWIAGLAAGLLVGLRIGFGATQHRFESLAPGEGIGRSLPTGVVQTHRDWRAVQRWARDATPPGTRFVTPPTLAGWRVFSDRPTTGELRDGGIFFYGSAEGLLAWRDRMASLGQDDRLGLAWTNDWDLAHPPPPGSARAVYAARASDPGVIAGLGASFVVLEAHGPAPTIGPVVFENPTFRVIAVGGAAGGP